MERLYWNNDWKFAETWEEAMKEAVYPENKMEDVRLPHTCKELPYHYFDEHAYQMLCGYRRHFMAPEAWQGKSVELTFEGVAHDAVVYVNGTEVKAHHCGYTAFSVELAKYLKYGEDNVLAVRVDSRENLNIPPFGYAIDYMTFGGMYREVYVQVRNKTHLADVFVKSQIHPLQVTTEITVQNISDGITLQQEIRKKGEGAYSPLGKKPVKQANVQTVFPVQEICLWEPENPHLYEIRTSLWKNGEMIDARVDITGFREAGFRKDGFYLNGKKLRLRGLNRHQSYPYVGYAAPASMQIFDADILKKELGVNAVRTSHYPQSQDFIRRCDEIGLLVFTEFPGWQHIGDEAWQAQALQNCREMVCQCRNHPSVFLWGVRVNGSSDNEAFYKRTNEAVHRLDPTRPTAGTRSTRKSQLLEDVYAYNDYSYAGRGAGCANRAAVTPATRKGYLISAFGGQNFPAKPFDDEPHRLVQALHHAAVLNDSIAQPGVAGSFGWCMTDYNTHREFGSGDRICYHGVTDLFRNPKLSAAVYASQKTPRSPSDVVFEVSSSMALGDHPGGFAGACWVFTNAESVRLYRGNDFIAEFTPDRRGRFAALPHPPIEIQDFVGSLLEKYEGLDQSTAPQVAAILNEMRRDALNLSPLSRARMLSLRLSANDLLRMYYKYIGVLGGPSSIYRFEAVWHGRTVRTVVKEPVQSVRLECVVHNPILTDGPTWDCAAVSLRAIDQNGNLLPYCGEAVQLSVEGPVKILGPAIVPLRGGMAGTYLATTGEAGRAVLHCRMEGALDVEAALTVRKRSGAENAN